MAIALTFIAYSSAQILNSYSFIAVFIAALAFRRYEHDHEYHKTLHNFIEQIERLLVAMLLILLGIATTLGMLGELTWELALLGLLFLIVIRPVTGWIGLAGRGLPARQRLAVSILGIRGVGSFYYLAYGLNHSNFSEQTKLQLWAAAGFVVFVSIFMHGFLTPWLVKEDTENTGAEIGDEKDASAPMAD